MAETTTPEIEATACFLEKLFESAPLHGVAFKLWDGTMWPDEKPRPATIVLKHAAALHEMFGTGTEKGLAEAFLRDDFDVEGDMEAAFEIADALGRSHGSWLKSLHDYYRLSRLPAKRSAHAAGRVFSAKNGGRHSISRDSKAVSFHYDLSNDFYRLWLDRRMLYSCAYFERVEEGLDEAQERKLRHVCRKLRLRAGQRLLDIGCGWGGLALFAARHYGVRVTGVTLSDQQAKFAAECVRTTLPDGAVTIQLKDYRQLEGEELFDAIVSVGMSEHVGANQLPDYFKTMGALLKPGGVFLNHAIGEGVNHRRSIGPSFMDQYVFPDSEIPPVPQVLQAAEAAKLEVRDVENLREHYALTLRHWVCRLEAAHDQALAFVDEATFRVWRVYMAGSARGFSRGQLAVYQVLLSKPDGSGQSNLPLTRRDWYDIAP